MYTAATLENELHVLLDAAGFSQREKVISQRILALLEHASTLKTRLAMREQQLRESDAALVAEKAKVDDLRLVAVRADMQRMVLAERVGTTEPETAPEPWEAIVTAAIRWRRGADRGELAAAIDAFTGEVEAGGKLRPEQYADGAGAEAWRQAMGGKICACAGELIGREQVHGLVKCSSGFESS